MTMATVVGSQSGWKTLVCIQRVHAFVWFCYKYSALLDREGRLTRKQGDVCACADLGVDARGEFESNWQPASQQIKHTHTRNETRTHTRIQRTLAPDYDFSCHVNSSVNEWGCVSAAMQSFIR